MLEQHPDGNVVDQYIVPGETMHVPEPIQVPGVTTVMENQESPGPYRKHRKSCTWFSASAI